LPLSETDDSTSLYFSDDSDSLLHFKFGNERMAMKPQNAPTSVSIDSGNHDGIRRPRSGVALEKHYSVAELAKLWELSERTIRRIFSTSAGRLADEFIGGWQTTGVVRWTTGFPFSVNNEGNFPTNYDIQDSQARLVR
jgi:hypothetical protein